jgi:hypothetical protein
MAGAAEAIGRSHDPPLDAPLLRHCLRPARSFLIRPFVIALAGASGTLLGAFDIGPTRALQQGM